VDNNCSVSSTPYSVGQQDAHVAKFQRLQATIITCQQSTSQLIKYTSIARPSHVTGEPWCLPYSSFWTSTRFKAELLFCFIVLVPPRLFSSLLQIYLLDTRSLIVQHVKYCKFGTHQTLFELSTEVCDCIHSLFPR